MPPQELVLREEQLLRSCTFVLCAGSVLLRSGSFLLCPGTDLCGSGCPDLRSGPDLCGSGCSFVLCAGCSVVLRSGPVLRLPDELWLQEGMLPQAPLPPQEELLQHLRKQLQQRLWLQEGMLPQEAVPPQEELLHGRSFLLCAGSVLRMRWLV